MQFAETSKNMLDEAIAEGVRRDRSANVSGPETETGSVERGDTGVEENPRIETESKNLRSEWDRAEC